MTDTDHLDRAEIRSKINYVIKAAEGHPTRADVVDTAATLADVPEDAARDELDELEKAGLVYCVGDGDAAEVKRP